MGACLSAPEGDRERSTLISNGSSDVSERARRAFEDSLDWGDDDEEGRGSLMPGSETVTRRQLAWVRHEQGSLGRNTKISLEEHFRALLRDFRGTAALPLGDSDAPERVPRAAFIKYFKKNGTNFDEELFDMIFKLFDADADGEISQEEFIVAFGFITYRGSVKDHVELAFRLFDTNRDEFLSRREFNEMISSLIGSRVHNVLRIEGGHVAFEAFLEREHNEELLHFLKACGVVAEDDAEAPSRKKPVALTAESAQEIFDSFLEVGAPNQINVSQTIREDCRAHIEKSINAKDPSKRRASLTQAFHEASREVLHILESGPLLRFKVALRKGDHSLFANAAWLSVGLRPGPGAGLSLELFREWAAASPGAISLFDELSDLLEAATVQLSKRRQKEAARATVKAA